MILCIGLDSLRTLENQDIEGAEFLNFPYSLLCGNKGLINRINKIKPFNLLSIDNTFNIRNHEVPMTCSEKTCLTNVVFLIHNNGVCPM